MNFYLLLIWQELTGRKFKQICNKFFGTGNITSRLGIDETYDTIVQNIVSAAEMCIPKTKPMCRQKRLPYWNSDCKKCCI